MFSVHSLSRSNSVPFQSKQIIFPFVSALQSCSNKLALHYSNRLPASPAQHLQHKLVLPSPLSTCRNLPFSYFLRLSSKNGNLSHPKRLAISHSNRFMILQSPLQDSLILSSSLTGKLFPLLQLKTGVLDLCSPGASWVQLG